MSKPNLDNRKYRLLFTKDNEIFMTCESHIINFVLAQMNQEVEDKRLSEREAKHNAESIEGIKTAMQKKEIFFITLFIKSEGREKTYGCLRVPNHLARGLDEAYQLSEGRDVMLSRVIPAPQDMVDAIGDSLSHFWEDVEEPDLQKQIDELVNGDTDG